MKGGAILTELERDNILLDLQKRMDTMQGRMDTMQNTMDNMQGRMDTMQGTMDNMQKDNVRRDNILDALQKSVNELKQETRNISQSVAVIENDHGEKLQVLLDVYPEFYKKFASFAENFVSHDHRLDNLEARVYSLESKAANQ